MKNEIHVVGAVIKNGEFVFCAQRSNTMLLPGLWEFPGGKIELHESREQALVREIQEELNCTVHILDFITTTQYEYDFAIVNLTTYICELVEGKIRLNEHMNGKWVQIANLQMLNWAPADIESVQIIQNRYQ